MPRPVLLAVSLIVAVAAAMSRGDDSPAQAQLDFANGLFHRGFFHEAVEEYERYLHDFPEGPERTTAWRRLGEAACSEGQYEKALDAFDQVIASPVLDDAARQQAALRKGEVLYSLKRLEEAVAVLSPLTASEIGMEIRDRALYYAGKAYHDGGDTSKAFRQFKTLIEELPDSPLASHARYQLAFVHLGRNEPENAAIEFSAVANSKAGAELRMESRYRAAEIYDKIAWYSAAVGAYEQLRTEFPESAYARRADYGYAWALYHAGKYPEAMAAVEAFLKASPESPYRVGMEYLRANCLQQQKRYDEALIVYQEIREHHPDTEFALRAAYKIAWAHYLTGDSTAAKSGVTAFLQTHKDSVLVGDAAFLLGTILVAEGNYEDAYQEFRLVAEKYPNSEFGVEALYKSGECLAQLGLTDKAAEIFEEFAKRYPANPLTEQAMLRAGDAEFKDDDFAKAITKYKEILDNPIDFEVEQTALYRLAITYHNMKDFKASAAAFRTLLERFLDGPHTAEAHFRIAEYLLREKGDALKALEEYQAALDAGPEGAFAGRALRGLALARYERKDYDMAAELFLRLMQESPDVPLNEETYAWAGQRFLDQETWDKAAQAFEALLERVPGYPYHAQVRFKIAECAERTGKPKNAIALYQAVIDAAPKSTKAVEAKYRMARLYEAQNQHEKAFALYQAASQANNGDVAARATFHVGELLEAREEFSQAARTYMRVAILFLHPELSPKALWRAGQCFEKAGGAEQAKKAYQEIVSDYPETEDAAQAKQALSALGQGEV